MVVQPVKLKPAGPRLQRWGHGVFSNTSTVRKALRAARPALNSYSAFARAHAGPRCAPALLQPVATIMGWHTAANDRQCIAKQTLALDPGMGRRPATVAPKATLGWPQ